MCESFLKEVVPGKTCKELKKQGREGEEAKQSHDPRQRPSEDIG